MGLIYNGSIFNVDEIKEYLAHKLKASDSLINSFFRYTKKVLNKLETEELKDLYYNYKQYLDYNKCQPSTPFIKELFGNYYFGAGMALIQVLGSIEKKDKEYFLFKRNFIEKDIEKINKRLEYIRNENKSLNENSESYKNNLQTEIYILERKNELSKQLQMILDDIQSLTI